MRNLTKQKTAQGRETLCVTSGTIPADKKALGSTDMFEEKMFIGNQLTHLFVIFDRLHHCTFPRGILNSYKQIETYISNLKHNSFPATFDKEFADHIAEQNQYSKRDYNSYLLDKLLKEPTIATLERETKYFLDMNIPAYIADDKTYITEELSGKSRKATKLKLIESAISNCVDLTLNCNDTNFKLLEAQIDWLSSQKSELEK